MLLTGKFYVRCKYFGEGKNVYPVLSTSISNTKLNGEKETSFVNVFLSKSAKAKAEKLDILKYDEETNIIEVKDGWLSPNNKGGVSIFVNDFDFETQEENDNIYPDDLVPNVKYPKRKTTSTQAPKRTTTKNTSKK